MWWTNLTHGDYAHSHDSLYHELHSLKIEAKVWIKDKLARMESESKSIDSAIVSLLSGSSNGILSNEDMTKLTLLRTEKKKILDHYLLTWQLKSRTKWAL